MTNRSIDKDDLKSTGGASSTEGGADSLVKQTSIAEARDHLASLVHDVEDGAPVEITRRGRPVAVLVSYHEYQRLLGEGPSFWDAMLAYRRSCQLDDPQALGIDTTATFPRDNSPGRNPPFAD